MNLILDLPHGLCLAALFVVGTCIGSLVNLGVYRLAWQARPVSPWSTPAPEAPPRRWYDRVPIFGWLGLKREAAIHGRRFWLRPMLVEVACGAGLAALYTWEISRSALLLPGVPSPGATVLRVQYVCHVVLIGLMLVASLIDADEKIIPDTITVPGTLLGLLVATVYPWSLFPDRLRSAPFDILSGGPGSADSPAYDFLRLTSPNPWPGWLGGFPNVWPLVIGLGCWWAWCFALTHRTWYSRHGYRRALELCLVRLWRSASTWRVLVMGLIGTAGTLAVWHVGGDRWAGLLTALVGMAVGGGVIWAIRLVGAAVLRREAMGFGDVTLMAMIGSFLGWQAFPIIVFIAAVTGLVVGVIGLVLRHGPEIPYGPFLCIGALVVILRWPTVWQSAVPVFALGAYLIPLAAACLILMVPLLAIVRLVKTAFGH